MITPDSEAALAEVVAQATTPFALLGGGTRTIGRPVVATPLSTRALTGIALYEPGALTLVVRAGTRLADITATLAAEGQRLPFEVPDLRALLSRDGDSTIGGVVAANASGPRRVQAGACRDSLIGLRFVDGTGTVIRNGGRVMKNVTGYDLVKLLAGSHGTLGVLTELAFKLLPIPETATTLALTGLDDATAIAALSAALTSPFEVSGAAHLPGQATYLRLEGFAPSVAYRAGCLQSLLSRFGAVDTDPHDPWPAIRDVAPFHGQAGDVWRLSVKPGDAPALVARAGARAALYDWGGGLVWLLTDEGRDLRAALGPFTGHATLMRASAATRARIAPFHPEPAPLAALTHGLRARFDPRALFNPGLMS